MDVGVIERSFGQVAPHADAVVSRFYDSLFGQYPRTRGLFKGPIDEQKQHLIAALVTIVQSLRKPGELSAYLKMLGGRHVAYGVAAGDYAIVGRMLIESMQQTLGDAWDPAWTPEWEEAYAAVASLMCPEAVKAA